MARASGGHLGAMAVAGDVNLATTFATLARCASGQVHELDGVTIAMTGLPVAFFNGAFAHGDVPDPAAWVHRIRATVERAGVPYLVWVREGTREALWDAGLAAGLRDAGGPPAMVLPAIDAVPAAPDELEITEVTDDDGLAAHGALLVAGFGMPHELVDRIVGPQLLADGLAVLVGRVDGVAVSTSLCSVTGTTAGVYDVATAPDARGHGYGEALTWAAIAAGRDRGCDHAVLQASEMGAPIYRRMGFQDVGRYRQLEGPPS